MHENVCLNQRWLNCPEIAFFFLTKNLTHNICIKECLFIQFVMVFFKLHFKSRGLGSVSVLINIFFKIKNNVMFNSRNVPYLSFV